MKENTAKLILLFILLSTLTWIGLTTYRTFLKKTTIYNQKVAETMEYLK